MERVRYGATFIGLLRERGHGRVEIDGDGQAVVHYGITDELDVRNTRRAIDVQAWHAAAGAREIQPMAANAPRWRDGDDLDESIARWQRVPLRAGGFRLFCAHQMGTCRMGKDPHSSVADPWGQLHDTKGVWIGDGSAFPTASGTNPMITIMALAHRTAEAIAATRARPPRPRRKQQKGDLNGGSSRHPGTRQALHRRGVGRSAGADTIDVINASTEEVMGRIPQGTPADVDRAVAAARAAFEDWSQTDLAERAELVRAVAAGLAARRDEIAATIAQELGMPIVQATGSRPGFRR